MSKGTDSSNWGAVSVATITHSVGLGFRGTFYVFRNLDNNDKFLFLLVDLGMGFSFGVRLNQMIRNLWKVTFKDMTFNNKEIYTKIEANKPFSSDDLNFSPGAEATIGIVVLTAAAGATSISAWPFFQGTPKPGEEVNNDYFTGQVIYSKTDIGLSANANYQFLGRWFRLYSWT